MLRHGYPCTTGPLQSIGLKRSFHITLGGISISCRFFQFCSCGRQGYADLAARVDACAQRGRSYEFSPCAMPPGCRPGQAALGFWRDGTDYVLYLRPAVSYQGPSGALARFFSRSHWRYPSFSSLTEVLEALGRDSLFSRLKSALGARVVGQPAAVEGVAFRLYGHLSKDAPRRPLSLILCGPTGVGKSELAKGVAPALRECGLEDCHTLWTELNTFTQAHSAYRLTGAPPGYVGYDDQPILEAVRGRPRTVFVFDELEKAHPEVLKVFMSILDEGRCAARRPDPQGNRELDFRRAILLFTTNADLTSPPAPLGFTQPAPEGELPLPVPGGELAQRLFLSDERGRRALVRSGVLAEIAGRFGGIIPFRPLDAEARRAVTARQIAALGEEFGLTITSVSPAIAAALTPRHAHSARSTVGILEGALTPLFAASRGQCGRPLRLEGALQAMELRPVSP